MTFKSKRKMKTNKGIENKKIHFRVKCEALSWKEGEKREGAWAEWVSHVNRRVQKKEEAPKGRRISGFQNIS